MDFVCPQRFDLMAKYLYVKHRNINYFRELYRRHILTFNNGYEGEPRKNSVDDFVSLFDRLIEDMEKNGYNSDHPIPVGRNGVIINGAHRLMASFYLGIKPRFSKINEMGNSGYSYTFFLNRGAHTSLEKKYADRMALEYAGLCKNLRSIVVYPVASIKENMSKIFGIISSYGYIYYMKTVDLNSDGVSNLIKEAYRGEEWIGGLFPQGHAPGGKAWRCVPPHQKLLPPTVLIMVCMNDLGKLVELKEKCRELFGLGKHSLHMSDHMEDTFRICSSLLNENSVHFLNNRGCTELGRATQDMLEGYFRAARGGREDMCLTSSVVLEMYGLRQARDLDYFHKDNQDLGLSYAGLHSGEWECYYHTGKDNILYDPGNHFYFNGFKFASLGVVKKMKEKRNEPKDIADILLMEEGRGLQFTTSFDSLDVSDVKMLYFCHIMKTSGSSLEPSKLKSNNNCEWTRDRTRQIEYFNMGHKFHVGDSYNLPSHQGGHTDWHFEYFETYQDSYNVFPNIKFSIVRNPFDLLCSYYHHRSDYNGKMEGWASVNRILNIGSFEDFIHRYCDETTEWPQPLLKQNLYSQLFDSSGRCMVDVIIKYEERNRGLRLLMDKFNTDFFDMGAHRRGNAVKKDYREHYTPEMVKMVEKKCRFELETFRYCFEGSTDNKFLILNKYRE